MGLTASFLPKPVVGVNGSGMHTNVSISKERQEPVLGPEGRREDEQAARWEFVDRILTHGNDICLLLNAERERLSPAGSALRSAEPDQGFGGGSRLDGAHPDRQRDAARASKFARWRPDANPYMVLYSIFKTGLDGDTAKIKNLRQAERYLPDNIYDALENFGKAEWTTKLLGEDVKGRYADLKQASADRCPRLLGTFVKAPEVQYHHEVYNQFLWNLF